ncbi:MAG TPA: hypothetical protein DIV86_00055 [Alphaproteobacteria bacterium]|nr:hypothetical protein [Alphaproteobacteria bacterium]
MTFVIIITAFLASLLTLFSGFGLGTLLMPVVAVFFPITIAVALTAFVHLLNNLFKLATLWRDVNWSVSLKFGIPALIATIPGAWLLTNLSGLPQIHNYQLFGIDAVVTAVKLAVGILLILFAFAEWFSFAKKVNISAKYLPWGGVLSGFFGGLSGHQGAFRSAFLLHAELNAQQFVATNAVIASLVDITRLLVYGLNITLLLEQVDVSLIIAATIAAFAGVMAGKMGIKKVTIGFIQKLVAIMLLLLGFLLTAGIL